MPDPTNKKQVQSFIGMINYLSKFSARYSGIVEPIREMAKTKYLPTGAQNINLLLHRWKIVSAPILAYYNPKKQTVLQTDASIKGLGTCLLQEEKPVYFAIKALTEAQQAYVAIELESLVVAWAMDKFHYFLYASHFVLENGQKPLEAIFSKSINQATPRLQRILIRTFPCHFTVWNLWGLTNQLADCLSHLGGQKDTIKLPKLYAYHITNWLCARSDSLQKIKIVTHDDD